MIKQAALAVIAITGLATLTGCASIVNGTNQSVSVNNGQIGGATCSLQNDKGKWFIPQTPGTVTVHRSFGDLRVNCEKRGYKTSFKAVTSKTKAMAFGNAIFGGVLGAGVDMADGAAYDYPADIYVPLRKGVA